MKRSAGDIQDLRGLESCTRLSVKALGVGGGSQNRGSTKSDCVPRVKMLM